MHTFLSSRPFQRKPARRFVASCLFLSLFTLPFSLNALRPVCDSTCSPDPTSPTYASTIKARALPLNSRGHSTPFSPLVTTAQAATNVGSTSYNYAIPILHLPGRNGLDLDLTLYYNSRVWTIDPNANTATFNADRDFPAYGFRLGFGLVEGPFTNSLGTQSYTLTEPDGTKRELRFISGTTYESFDSSYIDWNSATLKLLRKDGSVWLYQRSGTSTFYRPVQLEDTNGNYISITYNTSANADVQAINTITDTLGRVITFNYNASLQLTTISGPAFGGGTENFATFTWNTAQLLNFNFASPLTVADSLTSGSAINVITACTYPNSTGYTFVYGDWGIVDTIQQTSANGTVRSYVSYNYPTAATALSNAPTWTQQTVNDGVNTATWSISTTFTGDLVSANAITDPAGNVLTTNLNTSGWQTGLPSSTTLKDSHGTTQRTATTSWTQDNVSLTYALNPRVSSLTTTLNDSGQQSQVAYSYSTSYGNVSQVQELDFGLVLARTTQTDYVTDTAYVSAHIYDRPKQLRVYEGSGGLTSRTDLAYDASTLTSHSGAAQHDDSNYGTGFTTRGNLTSVTRYTNAAAGSGAITRAYTYDILGNQLTAQVDCCNLKQFNFSSTTQFAYPDSLVRGPSGTQFTTSWTYDINTGLVLTQTDENGQVTHFNYDNVNRLTSITRPDNVINTIAFDDNAAMPAATTNTKIDSSNSIVQIQTTDGAGRTTKVETKNGSGTSFSILERQYDNLGRISQASNPHSSNETAVWTTYSYDALSRPLTVTPPGTMGNYQYAYLGNSTTVTDPAGKQREMFRDALGRLSFVYEPGYDDGGPATGSFTLEGTEQHTACCPTIYDTGVVSITVGGITANATYSRYSTPTTLAAALAQSLNANTSSPVTASATSATLNLTAKQGGMLGNYISLQSSSWTNDPTDFTGPSFDAYVSQAMHGGTDGTGADGHAPTLATPFITVYNYDALNDLLSLAQGMQSRSYIYDSVGRLTTATTPEAGNVSYTYYDYGKVNTRTDARNEVTTYGYDGLHRLTSISYSTVSGIASTPGVTYTYDQGGAAANANDRLTTMTDGVGSETYQYDILGRMTRLTKTISGTAYPINYAYNYANELTSITYPSNRLVQQSYDSIGRLSQIQSGGTNYLSNIIYNSASEPTGLTYGNGVQAGLTYNAQLQLQSLAYTKGTSTLFSLNYDFTTGVPGDNGQIEKITDNLDSTKTTTYVYDAWLRLKSASNSQWNVTETYDRFGNRKSQSAPVANNVTPSTSTNRLIDSGYGYDAAGNMTADGFNTIVYDGENRIASATNGGASGTYTYDGNNLRVTKVSGGTTTVYIFSGSKVIAEYDNGAAVGSPSREYLYSGSQLLATIAGTSTTYHHADHLSERVATDQNGNVSRTFGHFPFGETWYETGAASKWKFTSYERDSESGNDYAMMRYNVNRLGRFASPDPVAGSISDPQSLNRYAYVENDPINGADPLGLYCYLGQAGCHQGAAWAAGMGLLQVDFYNLENWEPKFYWLPVYWVPIGQTGRRDNSSGPHINQKILADCIETRFGVALTSFVETTAGHNGSFTGYGPDIINNHGNNANLSIANDINTYSHIQLEVMSDASGNPPTGANERILGTTIPGNPSVNYTANDILTLPIPNPPRQIAFTQVHELGNSLELYTGAANGDPGSHGDNDAGQKLEDCVRRHHGFH